jgi:NADH:ubiquinone oxidoreductase subunit 4 (subunit M)
MVSVKFGIGLVPLSILISFWQELKKIVRIDRILMKFFIVIILGSVFYSSQRSRLAAVLAFEKQSARQPKPIRIINV